MNLTPTALFRAALVAGLLAASLPAQAGLIAHFKLDEGAVDPWTNMVHSADGAFTGTFGGSAPPMWITDGLPPLLTGRGETTAALTNGFTGGTLVTTFYGTNDSGGSVLGGNPRTVTAWVRTPANPSGASAGYLVTYGSVADVPGGRFTVRLDSNPGVTLGKLRLEISGAAMTGTNTSLTDGEWHHIAVVVPANARISNAVLYVDGNLQQTTVANPNNLINTVTNRNPVHLGNYTPLNANASFIGALDDVRIYDHALTAAEVLELVYGPGNPPAITQQPAPQTAPLGVTNAAVTFNVGVSGSPPLQFQWKKDGVDLPGATDQTLTLSPVTAADLGAFSVGVTNLYGGALSSAASLNWSTPPADPVQQTALVGASANFTLTMSTDSEGYTYQWRKDGAALDGQTTRTLTLTALSLADTADYSCLVTLGDQSASSAPAALRVLTPPASAYAAMVIRDGASAYWRLGEANFAEVATDLTGFNHGAYSNFFGFELGEEGALINDPDTAARFNNYNWIEVPPSASLQRVSAFSLEAWVKLDGAGGRQSILCARNQFFSSGYELCANGAVFQFRTGQSTSPASEAWNDLNGGTVMPGEWQHVVATYNGTIKRLFVNGEQVGEQTIGVRPTPVPLRVGAGLTFNPVPGNFLSGTIDEAAVYWKALTPAQVLQHYRLGTSISIEITRQNGGLVLTWPANWILQSSPVLGAAEDWQDVLGATSPYPVPAPPGAELYYRLRQP